MPGQPFSFATSFAFAMGQTVTEFTRSKAERSVALRATRLTVCSFGVSGALLLSACAAHETRAARTPIAGNTQPSAPVSVSRTIVTPTDAASIEEIFSRARVD